MANKHYKYKIYDNVTINKFANTGIPHRIGEVGKVTEYIDSLTYDYEVEFKDGEKGRFKEEELNKVYVPTVKTDKASYFEENGLKIGKLVDKKQLAYGDSVSKAYKLMKVFLEDYYNEKDNTYTIPEELLQHMLLQVRIIDKQNRIFSNPKGDLMEENPYGDTVGYGLLGMRMADSIK